MRLGLALLAALSAPPAAHAQRVLVCTEALTASREAASVYMSSVDFTRGEVLPHRICLPGPSVTAPLTAMPGGAGLIACSGNAWSGGDFDVRADQTFVSVVAAAPLRRLGSGALVSVPGWRLVDACALPGSQAGPDRLFATALRVDPYGTWRGRLDAYRWTSSDSGPDGSQSTATWALPGAPVKAVALPETRRIAVLCRGPWGTGTLLFVLDATTGKPVVDAQVVADEAMSDVGAVPADLMATSDGKHLLVLTTGPAPAQSSGEIGSWLHCLDTAEFRPESGPVPLPGTVVGASQGLCRSGESSCWIATRSPGTGFAYVLKVRVAENGPVKESEVPMAGVNHSVWIAPAPEGENVAVGVDDRLEIWPEGRPQGGAARFEAPIAALAWTDEGLLLGEAGRAHRIDPVTGKPSATVQLQCGQVRDIALVPARFLPQPDRDADGVTDAEELQRGTSSDNPDTDGDGLPDGIDAEPLAPSPLLIAPACIALDGKAAGHQLRDVEVISPHAESATWQVYWEREQMPWLVVYPTSGHTSAPFYMGVDPVRYSNPNATREGRIHLYLTGNAPGLAATGSPATIQLRVLPPGAQVTRILWLWDDPADEGTLRTPGMAHSLKALADLLAAPPLAFTHQEASGAYLQSLRPYSVVVLGAPAAAHGAVTRQAILNDYVAHGGALLMWGVRTLAPDEALGRWLAPTGIHIDTSVPVSGTYETKPANRLCRHIPRLTIRDGCAIQVDDPALALAPTSPESRSTAFAAGTYGNGRVAVLASVSPLQEAALGDESNRRFVADLFQWLAGAGRYFEDVDGDGLADAVEDRNHNGRVDPGESDRLRADTDGDGLSDGDEDVNRNGQVDEGETSPLNADSDGDGIWDGADYQPLPPAGAPHVAGAQPAEGPLQGGFPVLVTGRNFGSDPVVWFGTVPAPSVRRLSAGALIAQTPPSRADAPGDCDIRVTDAANKGEAVLPSGFHYTSRSVVTVCLRRVPAANDAYDGHVALRLEAPANLAIGPISLTVTATPMGAVALSVPVEGAAVAYGGRRMNVRPNPGGFAVDFSPGKEGAGGGELASFYWKRPAPSSSGQTAVISIERAHIFTANGQPLEVLLKDATVDIGKEGL